MTPEYVITRALLMCVIAIAMTIVAEWSLRHDDDDDSQ